MAGRSTTLLEVANLSLSLLGEDPITDISTPDTEAGEKLIRWFYQSIDEVQSEYLWRELMTHSANIAADSTNHWDDRKRYPLATDCLRPLGFRLTDSSSALNPLVRQLAGYETLKYDIVGDFLISEIDNNVDIIYLQRNDTPTTWSPELERCVAYNAAIKAGQNITSDVNIVKNLIVYFQTRVEPRARRLQAKYKTNQKFLPENYTYINLAY